VAEYLSRGEYDTALTLANEAAELGPDWYLTHQMLGRVLLQLDDAPNAIKELEKAVQLRPDDPFSHFQLGRAYRAGGKPEQAAKEQAEFLRLDEIRTVTGQHAVRARGATEDYVRREPLKALCIAGAAGMLMGMIMTRR